LEWSDIYKQAGGVSGSQKALFGTGLEKAVQGTKMHDALDNVLRAEYGDRFIYNPNYGPDFYATVTHTHIEVSTASQAGFKAAKYAGSLDPIVVTYEWDPIIWER
jgi:hypothetical protein